MEVPVEVDTTVDYEARAHALGIHLFPSSSWPFIICFGILFLALGAIPFAPVARITLAVIGGVIFLVGVAGWVLVEDVRMFPAEPGPHSTEAHH